jgi:hypothetical protein
MRFLSWFRRPAPPAPVLSQPWRRTVEPITLSDQRHYLSAVPYLLPKDETELHRLDFQHHALCTALGRHWLAPVPEATTSMLDVGCGTGAWVREAALAFPHAQIVGLDVDLSSLSKMPFPPSCRFVEADVLQGLPFPDLSFEYVHQRLLVAALPAQRWPAHVQNLARVTRPDGIVELLEVGLTVEQTGPQMQRFLAWGQQVAADQGFDPRLMEHLGDLLEGAGLRRVERLAVAVPLGSWGGRAGELLKKNMLAGFLLLRPLYCGCLDLSQGAFDQTYEALSGEWETFQTSYVFYGAYGVR